MLVNAVFTCPQHHLQYHRSAYWGSLISPVLFEADCNQQLIMRRTHNVAVLTLVIIGIVYLFAHSGTSIQQESAAFRSESGIPYRGSVAISGERTTTTTGSELGTAPVHLPETAPTTLQDGSSNGNSETPLLDTEALVADPGSSEMVISPAFPLAAPISDQDHASPSLEVEYQFQKDLDLDVPINLLRGLAKHLPHHYDSEGPKTYAFATFMATHNPSLKDPYYLAIHSLIYRLLWAQRSKTEKYPLVVFVAPFVTADQRALLSGAGALVRELDLVHWDSEAPNMQKRWRDQFSKLNMWKETEFDRIAYLDADALPLANIDAIFSQATMRSCDETKLTADDYLPDQNPVCENYVFAGVPSDPFNPQSMVNGGMLLFTPSLRMHQRLLQNYPKVDRYDTSLVEQGLLGWQFSLDGAFPSTALAREWGAYFPQDDEEGKIKVVHEKIWVATDGWTKREWENTWVEMLSFYGSTEFLEARAHDGIGVI